MDPILTSTLNRFKLFPIKYPEAWDIYEKSLASFWTPHEIDLNDDLKDWEKLNDNEKHFISHVLAFFANADLVVNENLDMNFSQEIQVPEFRAIYSVQNMIETIHNQTYSLLIDTYIKDEAEKEHLFNAIATVPAVKSKAEWMLRWLNRERSFGDRIVAFAAVECIFFCSSFAAIFWLKKRGLMPGLTFSNELISRDESMHFLTACLVHRTLQPGNRASSETIQAIVKEAVEIEKHFITEALPCALIGINADLMCQYIEFVANYALSSLGCEKTFSVKSNPLDFMELISIEGRTNFFEKRVGEYSKAGVGVDREKQVFSLDEDF